MDISELEEGESSGLGKDSDKFGMLDSPSVSNKDASTSEAHDGLEIIEDDKTWPTSNDLNNRIKRVITSYQRNLNKKEDVKTQNLVNNAKMNQEIKIGNQTIDAATLAMQNWDLQKLALYLMVNALFFVSFLLRNF